MNPCIARIFFMEKAKKDENKGCEKKRNMVE